MNIEAIAFGIQAVWIVVITYYAVTRGSRVRDLQQSLYNMRCSTKETAETIRTLTQTSNKHETILAKHTGQIKALNVKNFSDKESVAKRKDCKRDRILSNKTTQNNTPIETATIEKP